MNASITAYIGFRYPNWMDYARHQCRVQHLEGWECDLMNDIVADLMRKPETKLADLMSRETRKIVNGQPTTELDKFVLSMIKCNAQSRFASFRKNTVGQKIIGTHGRMVEVATFFELPSNYDEIDEAIYDDEVCQKMDLMHDENISILEDFGFTSEVIEVYKSYFILSTKPKTKKEKKIIDRIINHLDKRGIKNTIHQENYIKQIEDNSYSEDIESQFTNMHDINIQKLVEYGFLSEVIKIYKQHFIESVIFTSKRELAVIKRIEEFLKTSYQTNPWTI